MSERAEVDAASRSFAVLTLGAGLLMVFLLWGLSDVVEQGSPGVNQIAIPDDRTPPPAAPRTEPRPPAPAPTPSSPASTPQAPPQATPEPTAEVAEAAVPGDPQAVIAELRARVARLEAEQREAREESERELTRLRRHVDLLQDRIKEVVRREAVSFAEAGRSDGEVTRVAKDRVWIDVGFRHGLQKGTRFEAFRRDASGALVVTGVLQAEEVGADRSACLSLERTRALPDGSQRALPDPAAPLRKGDQVRNPVFSPRRGQVVVVVGDRLRSSKHTLAEVVARVSELGGRVDGRLTVETDLLVLLTDPPPELLEQAAFFGTRTLREDELLAFLGLE